MPWMSFYETVRFGGDDSVRGTIPAAERLRHDGVCRKNRRMSAGADFSVEQDVLRLSGDLSLAKLGDLPLEWSFVVCVVARGAPCIY